MLLAPDGPHHAVIATLIVRGQTVAIALPIHNEHFHQFVTQRGYTWDVEARQWTRTISPLTNGQVQDRAIELALAVLAAGWPLDCPDEFVLALHRGIPAPAPDALKLTLPRKHTE